MQITPPEFAAGDILPYQAGRKRLVVTVHEDDTAARYARRALKEFLLTDGVSTESHVWDFRTSDHPMDMAVIARLANRADILAVAAEYDSGSVMRIVQWLEHWLSPRRKRPAVLVAVGVSRESGALLENRLEEEQLARTARRLRMEFISVAVSANDEPSFTGNTSGARTSLVAPEEPNVYGTRYHYAG